MNLIRSQFGFNSTAEQVIDGITLQNKRAIVTGGASGIGAETVRVFAKAGAEVIIAGRNMEVAKELADRLNENNRNGRVSACYLDLSDMKSVRQFIDNFQGPLHLLVNNAGVMAIPELKRTEEGVELQYMTNYLGHFALTLGLHNNLKQARGARIVVVSSSGHLLSPLVFDDINFFFRPYDKLIAYGQSKTACNLFAVAASKRWAGDLVFANSLNPGAILTNLQRHVGHRLSSAPEFHKTIQQGAATSVFIATSSLLDGVGGKYFENCNESPVVTERPLTYTGVAAYSLDVANADRLWEISVAQIARF